MISDASIEDKYKKGVIFFNRCNQTINVYHPDSEGFVNIESWPYGAVGFIPFAKEESTGKTKVIRVTAHFVEFSDE